MRLLSKPSTARCSVPIYVLYLLSEPQWVSCVRLAEILEDVSHDSINRFLLREAYTPKDLYVRWCLEVFATFMNGAFTCISEERVTIQVHYETGRT